MLSIAVIGCGIVAQGHLAAIGASGAWRLKAIVEPDPERRRRAAERHSPEHAFESYAEALALPGLDAVAVCTHADSHHEIACAALKRGLHVLCEKPMADEIGKCREMVSVAESEGRLLAINFNTRTSPPFMAIRKELDEGGIGKVRVVRGVYDWSCHQWQPPERLESFMRNGGPVIDSGVHFFEAARWYSGQEFLRVDANGVFIPPYDSPQHVVASALMSGGAIALVEVGWLYTRRTKDQASIFNLTVIGDDGSIHYDGSAGVLEVYRKDGGKKLEISDQAKHFEVAYENFARSVEAKRLTGLASGLDGLRATEAAYSALKSAKENKMKGDKA